MGPNLSLFMKESFNRSWKSPYSDIILPTYLALAYEKCTARLSQVLYSVPAVCFSVNGFSNVDLRSVMHLMDAGTLPFVLENLRLDGEWASAFNLDKYLRKKNQKYTCRSAKE